VRIVKVDRDNPDPDVIEQAASVMEAGGVVLVPTDTVYGLAALPRRKRAIGRIYRMKGRPEGIPLAVIVARVGDIWPLARDLSPKAERIIRERLPGPLTVVVRRSLSAPANVAPDRDTIAVRVPEDAISTALAARVGPYAATSANLAGEPPAGKIEDVAESLMGKTDLALDAGPCPTGRSSAVVDITGEIPVVLRPGPGWVI
jgi:L-threonylcarbamoyladenylate synthase